MTDSSPINRIVRPQPVAVTTVWPGEAVHFTPWLAKNLDWLEPLGLGPLELVGTEVRLPTVNRALDILARTLDGRAIAIENQYLKTDHDHLTRGLAYAVGHEAKALIVISEDHGAEFVAIADYLNSAYEQIGQERGIAVFLVRLAVEQIGSSYVPRFTVVSRPNTWLAAVHDDQATGDRTTSAFLGACSEAAKPVFGAILDEWTTRPSASMRINPQSASISLDFPYIKGQPSRSVYVLYATGAMTVNRGYFIEFGHLSEDGVTQLDDALQSHFPSINDKPYYPSVSMPAPQQAAMFADWLVTAMAMSPPPSSD